MVKKVFKARFGSLIPKKSANVWGQRVMQLMREKKVDMVQPEMIVEDARSRSCPYHDWFEWNDSRAADKFRVEQARHLLQGLVEVTLVSEDEKPVEVRSFHVVVEGGVRGYAYKDYVFEDVDLSRQVVEAALAEAKGWYDRYKSYSELARISGAIRDVLVEKGIVVSGGGK